MDYFIMQTDSRLRRLPQLRIPKELLNMGDTEDSYGTGTFSFENGRVRRMQQNNV